MTPLSPAFWRMTFDGETISLFPSIGNWSYPCRSHHWIERNRVRWAPAWTDLGIEEARREDEEMRARYYREGSLYDRRDRLHDDVPRRVAARPRSRLRFSRSPDPQLR